MLLEIALLFCIVAFNAVEQASLSVRVFGASVNALAIGHHLSLIIMLANRLFTALALLLLGYAVDFGVKPVTLAYIFTVTGFILATASVLILARWSAAAWIFQTFYRVCYGKIWKSDGVSYEDLEDDKSEECGPIRVRVWFVYFATSLFFLGFLIPPILASFWPDARATLMQTGFLFNAIGSLIMALYVEKDIARIFQGLRPQQIARVNSDIAMHKSYAFITGALLFWIIGFAVV